MVARLDKMGQVVLNALIALGAYLRQHWRAVLISAGFVLLVLVGWAVYRCWGQECVWADWTGLSGYTGTVDKDNRGKTLWDWLELLIIPFVLAIGAFLLNRSERINDRKIAQERFDLEQKLADQRRQDDQKTAEELRKSDINIAENRAQDEVLQNYLDKMSELILEKNLMEVKRVRDKTIKDYEKVDEEELDNILPYDQRAVRDMAQVRTVTVLRQLNRDRRNIVLQFLRDADLADFILTGSSLNGADLRDSFLYRLNMENSHLSDTNLSDANLYRSNFNGANLDRAMLIGTKLIGATLIGSRLTEAKLMNAILIAANLRKADLSEADLRGANLSMANLSEAYLIGANLSGAKISVEQLSTTKSLEDAIMPDGKKYNPAIHKMKNDQPTSEQEN